MPGIKQQICSKLLNIFRRLPSPASRKLPGCPSLDAHVLKSTRFWKITMEIKQLMCSVVLIFSVCTRMRLAAADPETPTVWTNCGKSGIHAYRNGSAFQHNLNKVLESLERGVYPSGFNTSSVVDGGQNSNSTVYGLVQCRGDLDSSDCNQCVSTAKAKLVQGCQNTSGFIQLDGCFLRYDNHNFYNDIESRKNTPTSVLCNTGNSSLPQQFTKAVTALLSNITAKAAQSPKLFTADSVPVPSNLTGNIYGLAQCWGDLSRTSCGACLTYAFERIFKCQRGALGAQFGSQNCYLRYEIYEFFNTSVLSPPEAESPAVSSGEEGRKPQALWIILGVVAGALIGFIAGICLWRWNSASRQKRREQISLGELGESTVLSTIPNPELVFKYDNLKEASSNFDAKDKLGQGNYGSVFKGVLHDGRDAAIKRLYTNSRQGDAEFLNEASLFSRLQHTNLVKLFGCSVDNSERLLVYEYLQNGSLDKILFDATKRHLLSWKRRYEIIVGTARGLAYLHEECETRIIHGDIKPSNILLDDKYNPKIADFGLGRFFGEDRHVSRVVGTAGYMAPEYALRGQLTEKADVFSFGVLVLEIISGRKNHNFIENDMEVLIEETWRLYKAERGLEVMDPTIKDSYPWEEGIRVIKIGLLCTQASAALRPSMSHVVSMLTSETEHLPSPTRPAFIDVDTVGAPDQVIDPDKTWPWEAATSTTPSDTHSTATESSSNLLESS